MMYNNYHTAATVCFLHELGGCTNQLLTEARAQFGWGVQIVSHCVTLTEVPNHIFLSIIFGY